mgnify:CR=1 FL=1
MKKSILRRCIALLIVSVMLLGLAAGCSQDSKEDGGENDDKVTTKGGKEGKEEDGDDQLVVTMLYSDNASYQYKEDWLILEEIEKRTGVKLELIPVPESDWATKRTTIINSGDMPDIISKTLSHEVSDYATSGLFLPISDYLDSMPNLSAFIEEFGYEDDLDLAREADGKFYILPVNCKESRMNNMSWMIRQDLLDKHDLEMPKTLDDVLNVARVFKEAYPDVYPITNRFQWGNMTTTIARGFGIPGGWQLPGHGFYYDQDSDDFVFIPGTEEYKAFLEYMNTLYSEGLLDPEYLTLDSNVYEQRIANSQNLILCDWVGNDIRYNRDGQSIDSEFNIVAMVPPTGPNGDYAIGNTALYSQGWAIPASTAEREDFSEILEFFDWFYTEEAAVLTTFGVEGITYKVENDTLQWIDKEANKTADYGIFNNCLTPRFHRDYLYADWADNSIEVYKEMKEKDVVPPLVPSVKLTADQKEFESMYVTALADYQWTMAAKFVDGSESFDNWDAFVDECEKKGAAELRELYNEVWQEQKN